jgi:hypothetical protein
VTVKNPQDQQKYHLDITIDGLPAMYNRIGMRSHWVRRRNTEEWKEKVRAAVYQSTPHRPLRKSPLHTDSVQLQRARLRRPGAWDETGSRWTGG